MSDIESDEEAPEAQAAGLRARVVALEGTEACLWFPDSGELHWVDLAEIGYELVTAPA